MKTVSKLFLVLAVSLSTAVSLAGESCKSVTATTTALELLNVPLISVDGVHLPDFSKITPEVLAESLYAGLAMAKERYEQIANNPEPASFENTVLAIYEMQKVEEAFDLLYHLDGTKSSETSSELIKTFNREFVALNALLTSNEKIIERMKALVGSRDSLNLGSEDSQLFDTIYRLFHETGAFLGEKNRLELVSVNEQLGDLTQTFGENLKDHMAEVSVSVEDKSRLKGLPEEVIERFAKNAESQESDAPFVIDMSTGSIRSVMQEAEDETLRKQVYEASQSVASDGGKYDNSQLAIEIIQLRQKKANLLGFDSFADFRLSTNMLTDSQQVLEFVTQLQTGTYESARKIYQKLAEIKEQSTGSSELQPWDISYYGRIFKEEKLSLDYAEVKNYLSLDQMFAGAIEVAQTLYGIEFKTVDLPKVDESVRTFEVINSSDGSVIGYVYYDPFVRLGEKDSGAWHHAVRRQSSYDGNIPYLFLNTNFSSPNEGESALISLLNVTTLFHEFGHGLHTLLSKVKYTTHSGTAVSRDYVELPSQLNENFAFTPEVLKKFARHYETGEPMSDEMIQSVQASIQSTPQDEQFSAKRALLDIALHMSKPGEITSVEDLVRIEKSISDANPLYDNDGYRALASTRLSHIFSGSYASSLYGYSWGRALLSDIWELFKAEGVLNPELGARFRDEILARGGNPSPMQIFVDFMGRKPDPSIYIKELNENSLVD